MEIVGYSDRLSVAPGEAIRFLVSCARPAYRADLVQLIHGDETPGGPGFKERGIPSALAGDYPGRPQPIDAGSHVVVPDDPALRPTTGLTLAAWIWPTLPDRGVQGIIAKWSATQDLGYALVADERGCLALWLGDDAGHGVRLGTERPMRARTWYLVAASFDATNGEVILSQLPATSWPRDESRAVVRHATRLDRIGQSDAPLLIAACQTQGADGRVRPGRHFNGKIDRPRLFARALTTAEIAALRDAADPSLDGLDPIAAWDFTSDAASARVTDRGPHGLHGTAVNLPARAMTGHNWTGRHSQPALAPAE